MLVFPMNSLGIRRCWGRHQMLTTEENWRMNERRHSNRLWRKKVELAQGNAKLREQVRLLQILADEGQKYADILGEAIGEEGDAEDERQSKHRGSCALFILEIV